MALLEICAATLTCGIHLGTLHSKTNVPLNDFNPGIYAIHNSTGITGGIYKNSHKRTTTYAGMTVFREKPINLFIGAGTGYAPRIMPMIVPSVRFGNIRTSLIIKHPAAKTTAWGIHVSMEF